ncbi:MAG: hypothetical protein UY09_C0012G0045 [Parcubacteria group bacterium GW2011_GWA2_47_8]|nr:MAG: hypothetical protein UY09_C0012G0045 [Parcubacteria group bacterium GW2011_GWA2_47_8]OHB20873.1 MAG: tRNA (adenosine(37)-N6)-threonylcarbamoyltransferase complex ATPase subunit type 1 TsaE [Parcubacteria group bacterium RIFCSPHIGHO2_01_FULL_47_10b]
MKRAENNTNIRTRNAEETKKIAAEMGRKLLVDIQAGAVTGPVILALQGDLGAGKTTFVQGLASGLGIDARVTSPTFTIMQRYPIPGLNGSLYHIDCYRLEGGEQLDAIHFNDIVADSRSIIAIEWPERVGARVPRGAHTVKFREGRRDEREIEIDFS